MRRSMPELAPELSAMPIEDEGERRTRTDRRNDKAAGRRGRRISARKRRALALAGDILVIVVLVAAIIYSVQHARPIFAGQPTVAESLARRVPIAKPLLPPTTPPPDTGELAARLASPQFAADSAAFA